MAIKRSRVARHLACPALASLLASVACSAPLDAGDDGGENGPPPFSGTVNPSTNGVAPAPNGAANGSPNPSGAANAPEGQSNGAPLSPAAPPPTANPSSNAGANQGAGGSASTSPASAAGGASMVAPVQPGSMGVAGGSMLPPNNPPVAPPVVVTPPPNNPPVVTPQPVVQPPFQGEGCGDSAFFCEDFESFNVGPATSNPAWTTSTANGTLSIDSQLASGGARSLHVQTQGNGSAFIRLANFAPPNNSFFARMYLQAEAFPRAPDYAHFTLVEARGTGAGLIRPIGGQFIPGMGTLWGAGSDQGPTGDWTNWRVTTPTEAGRFLCIEWEMSSANNAINIWIDGVAKPELSVSTNSHGGNNTPFIFPRFDNIAIGWQLYQGGPTPNQFNLWFDDIVMSTERVGCK